MTDISFTEATDSLLRVSPELYARGWVPATSGNFSARISGGDIAITASGKDKSSLSGADILRLEPNGTSRDGGKPSAETGLHLQLYGRDPALGAVLHTHSLNAVVASMTTADEIVFRRLELLKAFAGIESHDTALGVPIFDNDQHIEALARKVEQHMEKHGQGHAYLIRGHGMYTWGRDMGECMKHLEAMEFLLGYHLRMNPP